MSPVAVPEVSSVMVRVGAVVSVVMPLTQSLTLVGT